MTEARCTYCNAHVEPGSRHIYRRVVGWERKAHPGSSRRGGSDIVLREPQDAYACPTCVALLQSGVNPAQGAMIL